MNLHRCGRYYMYSADTHPLSGGASHPQNLLKMQKGQSPRSRETTARSMLSSSREPSCKKIPSSSSRESVRKTIPTSASRESVRKSIPASSSRESVRNIPSSSSFDSVRNAIPASSSRDSVQSVSSGSGRGSVQPSAASSSREEAAAPSGGASIDGLDLISLREFETDESSAESEEEPEEELNGELRAALGTAEEKPDLISPTDLAEKWAATTAAVVAAAAAAAPPSTATPEPEEEEVGTVEFRLVGDALHTAVTGQVATFTIETLDASGKRRRIKGASRFAVSLAGAAIVRARVHDEGNGLYNVDYKLPSSGKYRLSVMRAGSHLPGSPFALVAKPQTKDLKEWKAERQKEASSLKATRKARERRKREEKARPVSPRLPTPYEQLQKAYALALASIGASDKDHTRASAVEHELSHLAV